MINYQWTDLCVGFGRVVDVVKNINVTSSRKAAYEKVHGAFHSFTELPAVARVSNYLENTLIFTELTQQWHLFYGKTYSLVHPTVEKLCNNTLHYGTGVSVGMLASVLIVIFILTRVMPQRLKALGYLFMLLGSSASLWFMSTIGNYLQAPVTESMVKYWQYILGYLVVSGIISFAIVYRYGPVSDPRTLNLIQWFLQCIGLVFIYNSSQIPEVSIAMIMVVLILYNFPRAIFRNTFVKNYWQRMFPPKITMLSEEEYLREGHEETKKELDKLRDYCKSPDCQAWKIISRLKSPQRFADFIYNGSRHVTGLEVIEHARGDIADTEQHSDSDSELVFILGSPNMRVSL